MSYVGEGVWPCAVNTERGDRGVLSLAVGAGVEALDWAWARFVVVSLPVARIVLCDLLLLYFKILVLSTRKFLTHCRTGLPETHDKSSWRTNRCGAVPATLLHPTRALRLGREPSYTAECERDLSAAKNRAQAGVLRRPARHSLRWSSQNVNNRSLRPGKWTPMIVPASLITSPPVPAVGSTRITHPPT